MPWMGVKPEAQGVFAQGHRGSRGRRPSLSLSLSDRLDLSAAVLAVSVLQHLVLIAVAQLVRERTELPAAVRSHGISIVFHCALEPSFVARTL